MGWYRRHVVPRVVNLALNPKRTGELRERVCAGLTGQVVEVGFGSGLNAGYYPPEVSEVLAVEPSDLAWHLAQDRVAASGTAVRRIGLDGQSLPLPDESADSALSTWTLCTIPDAAQALAEVRRVLKPGGTLHFIEHGGSPDAGVAAWQRRLEPVQKRIGGGCHLTRPIARMVTDAGFVLDTLETYYAPKDPKPFAWFFEGVARKA